MELKLTTPRALEFEKRTGKDLIKVLDTSIKENNLSLQTIVDLFIALGEKYTIEKFDAWDLPLIEKAKLIATALKEYVAGKN